MDAKVVLATLAILNGHWTYDAGMSRVLDPDLRITETTRETWTPLEANKWVASKRKKNNELETAVATLKGSTLSIVTHGKLPDGSPLERTVTYQRQGQGDGLIGLWRSIKVDTGATWDGFIISTKGGIVTWQIPTDLQVLTGPFDGSDLPVMGPNGPTGQTMAVRISGPRALSYVQKNHGQVSSRGTINLSRDGRWMTELTWNVDQPDRKSTLTYKRDR